MPLVKNYTFYSLIIFLLIFSNFILGLGFQNLSISIVPVTYILLFLLIVMTRIHDVIKLLNEVKISLILFLYLFYNLVHLYFGISKNGIIALRDANYIIDTLFIITTVAYASKNYISVDNLKKFFDFLFKASFIYLILWLFRDNLREYSPEIVSITGSKTNFLFNFSTIGYLFVFLAFYCLYFLKNDNSKKIFFWLFLILSITIMSKRYIYLFVIVNLLFIFLIDKEKKYFNPLIILIFIFLYLLTYLNFYNYIGINLKPLSFYINHILSSFPGYVADEEIFQITSSTVSWRTFYLEKILQEMTSELKLFFFGKGYGLLLVDFKTPQGIEIREPHNLYLTVFARTGFVGLMLFLILHIKIFNILFNAYKYFKFIRNDEIKNLLILIIIFYLFVFISAGITTSALSVGSISSQMYILSGMGISFFIFKKNFLKINL